MSKGGWQFIGDLENIISKGRNGILATCNKEIIKKCDLIEFLFHPTSNYLKLPMIILSLHRMCDHVSASLPTSMIFQGLIFLVHIELGFMARIEVRGKVYILHSYILYKGRE